MKEQILEVLNNVHEAKTLIEINDLLGLTTVLEYQELQKKQANEGELTKEEQSQLNQGINIFIHTEYINLPYDEAMTIENAYDFLKSLDKYAESIDV